MAKKNDLTGRKFGRLRVIGYIEKQGYVLCECQCGAQKVIRAGSLTKTKNPTRSCGCIQREKAREVGLKVGKNNFISRTNLSKEFHTNFDVISCSKPNKSNTSGHKGVYFHKTAWKYCAYITVQSKRIHLGLYDSYEDAVKAREEAEKKYFAPLIEAKQSLSC